MKKFIITGNFILLITLIMTGSTLANTNTTDTNQQTVCPIMGGEINKDIFTDYNGKRIYFCCNSCVRPFKENPLKYVKLLESEGLSLEQITETKQQDNHDSKIKKVEDRQINRKSGCSCCG